MAIGFTGLPELLAIDGIRLGTTCAGVKVDKRRDLVVIEAEAGTHCAAVFTRNAFCAAPVIVARRHLNVTAPRYLVINTGNANAGTGEQGIKDAMSCCEALAELADCRAEEVAPFSTGVIGEPLPLAKIQAGLPDAAAKLGCDGWSEAAYGIMTTDTVPKGVSQKVTVNGYPITVTGIAKGAGMIRPNMATMLAFLATDAAVKQPVLQSVLHDVVPKTFNRITVDGDTSTNDACVLLATGKSQASAINNERDSGFDIFRRAVLNVCQALAQAIVRDGEGATKFITIAVEGGNSEEECYQVADTIAHSPLVKTAFFACDPNWGRILAAVGRAGLTNLDITRIVIGLDEVCIVADGGRAPDYTEQRGQMVMARDEITVRVDLGRGRFKGHAWTCDFSYDYVRINAEYRT